MPGDLVAPPSHIQACLDDPLHAEAILSLLNAYSEEPVGAGAPLP
ncbi:hypothetical protein [Solemya velesiana gill symbiont]|nr:hypothetical protein [Solemya velesiana gill symbiont]